MLKRNLDMYWDVGSTNTYFALKLIKPILVRNNVELVLHPFNLGYVFRNNNYELMKEPKAKLRNRKQDLMRWAKKYDLPFSIPREFPIKSSRVLRGSLVMRRFGLEVPFVEKIMDRYWEQGDATISEYAGIRSTVLELGVDPDEFEALSFCAVTVLLQDVLRPVEFGLALGEGFCRPVVFEHRNRFLVKA